MLKIEAYHSPTTLTHAVSLLAEQGRTAIAGGTDLLVNPRYMVGMHEVVDIRNLDLDYIRDEHGWLHIGAGTTMRTVARHSKIQALANGILARSAAACGSPNIRNMATLAGNVASALPSADTPPQPWPPAERAPPPAGRRWPRPLGATLALREAGGHHPAGVNGGVPAARDWRAGMLRQRACRRIKLLGGKEYIAGKSTSKLPAAPGLRPSVLPCVTRTWWPRSWPVIRPGSPPPTNVTPRDCTPTAARCSPRPRARPTPSGTHLSSPAPGWRTCGNLTTCGRGFMRSRATRACAAAATGR